jgi:hypothetical protein
VQIKDVNVARSERFETSLDGQMERLVTIARVIHLNIDAPVTMFVIRRVLI